MSQRPPPRPSPAAARPAPTLTPIAQSAAWLAAQAQHGRALLPADNSAEAFDRAAMAFWSGGQVEHTFTQANLALLRMAQAEEHHLAQMQATAALRQDVAGLAARLAGLHKTLIALGRVSTAARKELVTIRSEALEVLGALADAWDSRPPGSGRAQGELGEGADENADGGDGDVEGDEELVEVDDRAPSAPARADVGRAARYARDDRRAAQADPPDEELIEVDEHGNPIEVQP
ncbi:MAG: hypothetical protein JNM72_26445 [Deltaproteobacteria bacterium]|nr:hypothetical protein [Deltaproteobacteria bacterium]